MVDKKETAEGWPIVNGDYMVGDAESPVAVATLASHNEDVAYNAGAAISGPCKTENLGIEKVIANVISNPNIRFLVLCGAEVQGHITGQSLVALHENGVDFEKGRIIGATGAIPFVENIPEEGITRFQQQIEVIDMIDEEDSGAITNKVKEFIEKDAGALEEDSLIIDINEDIEKTVPLDIIATEKAYIESK